MAPQRKSRIPESFRGLTRHYRSRSFVKTDSDAALSVANVPVAEQPEDHEASDAKSEVQADDASTHDSRGT